MAADKSDEHQALSVTHKHKHNQPVVVAFDVEHDTLVGNESLKIQHYSSNFLHSVTECHVTNYHWRMLNERLKNLRLAKGMTLQQVGDVFGISKVSVSTWESGKTNPDRKRLEKLADLYGTTIQYLVTGIEAESFSSSVSGKVPFHQWEHIKLGIPTPNENSWVTPIHCNPSKSAFATRYAGSSTLGWQPPGIPAGSILIVDPEVQSGSGDYLLVASNTGDLLLTKQAVTPDNKQLLLRTDSLNFKPITSKAYKTVGTVLEWQMSGKLK